VKSKDENITCGKIDQGADIKTKGKIADNRKKGAAKRQKDKLVKPNDLFAL
jgi:hypothetical protein